MNTEQKELKAAGCEITLQYIQGIDETSPHFIPSERCHRYYKGLQISKAVFKGVYRCIYQVKL